MTRLCTCPGRFASSLELSRKRSQPAEGSCKTCGGRYLVDGIAPITGNMLGTVGLEVANSVNTELSWKTVTKGKRSRKQVARSLNGRPKLASKSPKRVGDFSGSDSDKFVETASGQPFPDRIEYVPIKKRRHLLRSPSPPPQAFSDGPESSSPPVPTPSSQSEDLEHLSDHNASSGQHSSGSYTNRRELVTGAGRSSDDGVLGENVSGVTGGKLYSADDFSGIALLAAAACFNNMDDDNEHVKGDVMEVSSALQASNMSASPLPGGESMLCSVSQGQITKDLPVPEHKKNPSVLDRSLPASHGSDEIELSMAVKSVSSKVDRRHWDLNTLMEAWEEPHDDVSMGNKSTVEASVDGMQVDKPDSECCKAQSQLGTDNNNYENQMEMEPMEKVIEPSESKTQENKSEEFPCVDGSSDGNQDMHPKSPSQVCTNESLENLPLAESCHASSNGVCDGNINATTSCLSQGEDRKIVTGSTDLETSEEKVVLPEFQESEKNGHETNIQMKSAEDAHKTIKLPEKNMENSESTSEEPRHLFKCEDLSTSDISVGSQSGASGDDNGQEEKVSAGTTMHADSQGVTSTHDDHRAEEKMANIQDAGKGSVDDDSHKSDVSQDDHVHLVDDIEELQVDYDSPYEDGELRGSLLCCWDGNELEDGEHESVDYGSDGRGGEDSDTGDCPGSEVVEAGSEGSQGTEKKNLSLQIPESNPRKNGLGRSSLKKEVNDDKEKIEIGGKRGSDQGPEAVDVTLTDAVGERSGNLRRRRASDRIDVFDVKGPYIATTKGKLQSRIEGPSSLDIYERDAQEGRSRNIVGSLSRSERDGSPGRFVPRYRSAMHEHDRNGDSRWVYWDSRNRYSSSYRGLENHGQTRSRNGIADSVDKFGGLNFHDHKPINHSSKGIQRQLVRRRSPIDRVDFYGVHRRIPGIGSHRSRGSSGNFSEGIGRGLRDEFNEPVIDDSAQSSGRLPHHYLSRRDRSFSPPSRVTHAPAPRRKSRSRSRTRSPRVWQSQRERNLGTRRHSRSPEFRPESRVDRMRIPFQKSSFGADYGESFMSPPRGRFSPQRSYRWVDNRNFVDDHLRHRRSPGGVFRRNQKLDHVGFSGRLKSDDHFRPMGRPGRFPVMDGVVRGCKMEENCDDRRNDERSGMMQRGRHSETGAILRRSRHDAEDNFDACNLNNDNDVRSTDRRDVPRSTREDKRTFKV